MRSASVQALKAQLIVSRMPRLGNSGLREYQPMEALVQALGKKTVKPGQ